MATPGPHLSVPRTTGPPALGTAGSWLAGWPKRRLPVGVARSSPTLALITRLGWSPEERWSLVGTPRGKDQLVRVGEARLLGARHFESVLLSCRPGFEVEGSRQSTRGAGQAQGSGCEGWAKDVGPGVCVFGEVFRWSTLPGQRPHTMAPSSPRLPLSTDICRPPAPPCPQAPAVLPGGGGGRAWPLF